MELMKRSRKVWLQEDMSTEVIYNNSSTVDIYCNIYTK